MPDDTRAAPDATEESEMSAVLNTQQPPTPPQLRAALAYAGRGWSVVPVHKATRQPDGGMACSCTDGAACTSPGKHPALSWLRYQKARADEQTIRSWFTGQYQGYGVGIITGAISDLIVIDVDEAPGKPGGDTLRDLQLIHDDLPFTVQAKTGGGGRHLLFKHPGVKIITGRNVLGVGVDVRGDGGFIVAAPSLHQSGNIYLWDAGAHPVNTPLADLPEWVVDMARDTAVAGDASTSPRAAPTGTGEIIRDEWNKVTDGRERHMVSIICGTIAALIRENRELPAPDAVFDEAWPSYERTTRARGASLEADGRGESLMRQRITHFLRRAASGKWRVSGNTPAFDYDPITGEVIEAAAPIAAPAQKTAQPFEATSLDDLDLDHIPPRRWLYGRELVRGFVSVLGSPGGVGKTAYGMVAGFSIAANRPLLAVAGQPVPPTHKVHKTGAVWFYNLEDPLDEMRRRAKAVMLHHKVRRDEIAGRIFLDSGRDRPLVIAIRNRDGDLIASPLVEPLVAELKRRGIILLVVDPFVQSHGAEENRNEEMNLVMSLWGQVAHRADCAVWLVHHFRKGGQMGDAESFRGAGAIQGAARVMSTLAAMSKEDASKLGVQDEHRRQYIRLDNAKANMAPPADRAEWFKLVGIPLSNGDAEYPDGDYVQSVEPWQPPSPWEGIPWSLVVRVLEILSGEPSIGEQYTLDTRSKERWAGNVLLTELGQTEGQARAMLKAWQESGVISETEYVRPTNRKPAKGLMVDPSKVAEMRQHIVGGADE